MLFVKSTFRLKKRESIAEERYLLDYYDTLGDVLEWKTSIKNIENLIDYRDYRLHSAISINQIKLLEVEARMNENYSRSRKGISSGMIPKYCSLCGEQIFKSSFGSFMKKIARSQSAQKIKDDSSSGLYLVMVPRYGLCHVYCANLKSSKVK